MGRVSSSLTSSTWLFRTRLAWAAWHAAVACIRHHKALPGHGAPPFLKHKVASDYLAYDSAGQRGCPHPLKVLSLIRLCRDLYNSLPTSGWTCCR